LYNNIHEPKMPTYLDTVQMPTVHLDTVQMPIVHLDTMQMPIIQPSEIRSEISHMLTIFYARREHKPMCFVVIGEVAKPTTFTYIFAMHAKRGATLGSNFLHTLD